MVIVVAETREVVTAAVEATFAVSRSCLKVL